MKNIQKLLVVTVAAGALVIATAGLSWADDAHHDAVHHEHHHGHHHAKKHHHHAAHEMHHEDHAEHAAPSHSDDFSHLNR